MSEVIPTSTLAAKALKLDTSVSNDFLHFVKEVYLKWDNFALNQKKYAYN